MSKTVEERLDALEALVDQLVKNNNNAVLFMTDAYKRDDHVPVTIYNDIDFIEKEDDDDDD